MSDKPSERRSQKRVIAKVPVTLQSNDGRLQATGHTRDLSSNGIFLYTEENIAPGSDLEIMLVLPPEFTGGEKRWACCHASVCRVEEQGNGGQIGLAARVRRFEILPEIPS